MGCEEGERAYRAEIMAALGCHTAFVLQEIARLREVAAEAIGLEEVRQREQRARDEGERIGAARDAGHAAALVIYASTTYGDAALFLLTCAYHHRIFIPWNA